MAEPGEDEPRGHRPVTDRARAALLPDETPVEELPLRRHTINALRAEAS